MATNSIKGLTVEIGGDTTKLGKALEDVNKKSTDLSSELGQINRLLKLDPGNTELLAQKQKVLAEAVSNTAKKLDTLKEAERQVQKQFERGEVSEEQVRALQREIIATEKKMDGYKKAVKEKRAQQLAVTGYCDIKEPWYYKFDKNIARSKSNPNQLYLLAGANTNKNSKGISYYEVTSLNNGVLKTQKMTTQELKALGIMIESFWADRSSEIDFRTFKLDDVLDVY